MEQLKVFFGCLFNPDESTCFTSEPNGTRIYKVGQANPTVDAFFSINALDGAKDNRPTEEWHRPDRPRRCDDNVVSFRNILIEMDKISLEEQKAHIEKIKLPYSTAVFSGSKSVHYIISLETPLTSRAEYDALVRRVYKAVGRDLIDRTCKNPSRLSRMPLHQRMDKNGATQELLEIKGRINNIYLENWLVERGAPPEDPGKWVDVRRPIRPKEFSSLNASTRNFLMGAPSSDPWNIRLFKASAELCRCGWSLEEAFEELKKVTGTLDRFDEKTIKSGFRNETNKTTLTLEK